MRLGEGENGRGDGEQQMQLAMRFIATSCGTRETRRERDGQEDSRTDRQRHGW